MGDDIDPSQQVTWDDPKVAATAPLQQQSAVTPAPPSGDVAWDEDKYGTLGQQALTVAEGAAQGFAGPIATAAEEGLSRLGVPGLSAAERKGRQGVNPGEFGTAEAASLVGGMLTGTGEAALLGKAGATAAKLFSAGEKVSRARAAGAAALRSAVEMAGFTSADEVTKAINGDPQTAQSIIAHVGLSAILGGAGGAVFGAVAPKWALEHAGSVEQGLRDYKGALEGTIQDAVSEEPLKVLGKAGLLGRFSKLKPGASEVVDIGQRNEWPILDGMVSGSKEIQMADDALLNGPPTIASVSRRQEYQKASDAVTRSVDNATSSGPVISETEAGAALKNSLLNKIKNRYEPIKAIYQEIEPYKHAIPLAERSTGTLTRTIEKIIEDKGIIPGSERYNFIKTAADGIGNVDNLQKLANFRTEVSRGSGPLTKDLAGIIADRLDGVEERAIKRFADTMKTGQAKNRMLELIEKSQSAKSQYASFRDELQELGNSLGKKKIYGPQNFMDFIEDLNPQTLSRRAFNENNTEFATAFAKKFPDEMGILRNYQRGTLREAATKEGALEAKKLTKSVLGMEPEMQKILYTDSERQVLQDAHRYIESWPKSFNPSGTAHETAFRAFFEHPTGAAIANLRDFGIQAFIKAAGRSAAGAEREAGRLLSTLGTRVADQEANPAAFKSSVQGVLAAAKGIVKSEEMANSVFSGVMPAANALTNDEAEKLDKHLETLRDNPTKLYEVGGDMGHYMPDHSQDLATSAAAAVNQLNGLRPTNPKLSPLDSDIPLSKAQLTPYYRALSLAEKPLGIFSHINRGTLLASDVKTLQSMYPGLYGQMTKHLTNAMTKHLAGGHTVPYRTRQSLSLFLGQSLDSTMTPAALQSIQSIYQQKGAVQQAPQGGAPKKGSPSKLGKMANNLRTPEQARADRAND